MNNWKTAQEMFSYTQQNIEARDALVDRLNALLYG